MNYNRQHQFYCGVDLHARSMFTHVLNAKGKTVFADDLPADADEFLDAITPFRQGLVVGAECMFAWYRLATSVMTNRSPSRSATPWVSRVVGQLARRASEGPGTLAGASG